MASGVKLPSNKGYSFVHPPRHDIGCSLYQFSMKLQLVDPPQPASTAVGEGGIFSNIKTN